MTSQAVSVPLFNLHTSILGGMTLGTGVFLKHVLPSWHPSQKNPFEPINPESITLYSLTNFREGFEAFPGLGCFLD